MLNTPGAVRIVTDAVHELTALRTAAHGRPVQLLVNCWYGRHRAPAIADAIGHRVREAGAVQVTHHHIDRPPVPRQHPRPDCPFCRIIHDGAPAAIVHEWHDAPGVPQRPIHRAEADRHAIGSAGSSCCPHRITTGGTTTVSPVTSARSRWD
ncbi:hypothetical protein OG953_43650 (plasmid) [Streptomyces sp. NBC_00057]